MPKLLDFKCSECEHEFEALVFASREPPVCPECSSEELEKVFTAPKLGFMNDPEKRHTELKRRADAHTRKEQQNGNIPGRGALGDFDKK